MWPTEAAETSTRVTPRTTPSQGSSRLRAFAVIGALTVVLGGAAALALAPTSSGVAGPSVRGEAALAVSGLRVLALEDGNLSIRRHDGSVERVIGSFEGRALGQMSPAGTDVLLTDAPVGRHLSIVSLTSGTERVLATAPPGHVLGGGVWASDGTVYFIQHAERGGAVPMSLYRVAPSGGPALDVTPREDSSISYLLPLPDGRLVAVLQRRGSPEATTPFLFRADGTSAAPLLGVLPLERTCTHPAISPKADRIVLVCSSSAWSDPSLVIYDLASATTVERSFAGNGAMAPMWSSDGASVFMAAGPPIGCKPQIVRVDIASGAQVTIIEDAAARFRLVQPHGSGVLAFRIPCRNGETIGAASLQWVAFGGQSVDLIKARSNALPHVTVLR